MAVSPGSAISLNQISLRSRRGKSLIALDRFLDYHSWREDMNRNRYIPALATMLTGAFALHGAAPQSVRVYVFDCGTLEHMDPTRFQLKKEEVGTDRISAPCFLVAHPKGTLMWDT